MYTWLSLNPIELDPPFKEGEKGKIDLKKDNNLTIFDFYIIIL